MTEEYDEEEVKKVLLMLVRIRDQLRRINQWWSGNERKRSFIRRKLEHEGSISVDDLRLLARFHIEEEAKEFLAMFAQAYGYLYDGQVLTSVAEQTGASLPLPTPGQIATKEIERVTRIATKKTITRMEDLAGYYQGENVYGRIKEAFKEAEKMGENLVAIEDKLINASKLDKGTLVSTIVQKICQTFPDVTVGKRVLLKPKELSEIVGQAFAELQGIDESSAAKILKYVFKNNERVSWEDPEMGYRLGSQDQMYLSLSGGNKHTA